MAKRLSFSAGGRPAIDEMAAGLREAATWVGCDAVALREVDPPAFRAPLEAALA